MKIIYLNPVIVDQYILDMDIDTIKNKFCNYLLNHHYCRKIQSFECENGYPTDSKFDDFAFTCLCNGTFTFYETMSVEILVEREDLFLVLEEIN